MTELPYNRPPRSRLPWLIAGAALVVVLVLAGVWWGSANTGDEETSPPPSTAPTPSASEDADEHEHDHGIDGPDDPNIGRPSGCIAGNVPDAAMLLEARELAPQTSAGAVEFAAAAIKFLQRYPYPSEAELAEIAHLIDVGDADITTMFDSNPTIAPNVAPADTPIQATMVGGAWYLESFDESEGRAEVTIAHFWNVDGVREGSIAVSMKLVLAWDGEGWTLTNEGGNTMRPQDVLELGAPFVGAC